MDTESILEEVGPIRTLAGALDWALGRTPPAEFVDVIAQDEFTQDVIVRVGPRAFVVFDTT
jgi:hypothetical protein